MKLVNIASELKVGDIVYSEWRGGRGINDRRLSVVVGFHTSSDGKVYVRFNGETNRAMLEQFKALPNGQSGHLANQALSTEFHKYWVVGYRSVASLSGSWYPAPGDTAYDLMC